MTTTRRTDIHRPGSDRFDPQAYDIAGYFDNHPEDGNNAERRDVVAGFVALGYRIGHGSSGRCGHCGTPIRYSALMLRQDVKEMIFVGEQCLDNRFTESRESFQALRRAARLNSERRTIREQRERFLNDHPIVRVLTDDPDIVAEDSFLWSLADALRTYGRLTDRQLAALPAAINRTRARIAKRDAQPTGSHLGTIGESLTVAVEITTAMTVDNPWSGGTQRFIVGRTADGDTLSLYSAARWAREAQKGNSVTLTAIVKEHREYDGRPDTRVGRVKITK